LKKKKQRNIEHYTEEYNKHNFEDIQVQFRKKEILKHYYEFNPSIVLEIGCGMNPFFLENIKFDKYVVVEPSKFFSENANKLKNSPNIFILNDYLENIIDDISTEKFDLIILSGLLHEIMDINSFIKKIKCLVHEKTIIHINVPNAKSLHRILAYESGLIKSCFDMSDANLKLQQHRVFDMCSLIKLVEDEGFKVLSSGSYFIKPFTHEQMYNILNRKIIDSKVIEGFNNLIKYLPEYGSEIYVNIKV